MHLAILQKKGLNFLIAYGAVGSEESQKTCGVASASQDLVSVVCTNPHVVSCEKAPLHRNTLGHSLFVKWSDARKRLSKYSSFEHKGVKGVCGGGRHHDSCQPRALQPLSEIDREIRDPSTTHTNLFTPIDDEMETEQRQHWEINVRQIHTRVGDDTDTGWTNKLAKSRHGACILSFQYLAHSSPLCSLWSSSCVFLAILFPFCFLCSRSSPSASPSSSPSSRQNPPPHQPSPFVLSVLLLVFALNPCVAPSARVSLIMVSSFLSSATEVWACTSKPTASASSLRRFFYGWGLEHLPANPVERAAHTRFVVYHQHPLLLRKALEWSCGVRQATLSLLISPFTFNEQCQAICSDKILRHFSFPNSGATHYGLPPFDMLFKESPGSFAGSGHAGN